MDRFRNSLLSILLAVLIGIIAWMWQGVDGQLARIDKRLRQVEMNQTKMLTLLGTESVRLTSSASTETPEICSTYTWTPPNSK